MTYFSKTPLRTFWDQSNWYWEVHTVKHQPREKDTPDFKWRGGAKDFWGLKFTNSEFFGVRKFWQVFFLGSLILVGILLDNKKKGRFAVQKIFHQTVTDTCMKYTYTCCFKLLILSAHNVLHQTLVAFLWNLSVQGNEWSFSPKQERWPPVFNA